MNKSIRITSRRNANKGSLLFNKFGFAQLNKCNGINQSCKNSRCKTCQILFDSLEPIESENFNIKFCEKSTCKSENIIYLEIENLKFAIRKRSKYT